MNGGDAFRYTCNRELSWLKFNQRVLEEAVTEDNPLFERLKFLSIFVSNLDEFYMIRVGSLTDQTLLENMPVDNKTGLSARQQLDAVFAATQPLYLLKDATYRTLVKRLADNGVVALAPGKLTGHDQDFVEGYFYRELQPLLSPQIIDTHHPFPHLPNKVLHVAAALVGKKSAPLYGLIPIGPAFQRVIFLPGRGVRYVLAEDVVLHYAERVFQIYGVAEKTLLCVTRNADLGNEQELDEDVDYRVYMKEILRRRNRLAPVRLEVQRGIGKELERFFCGKLDLKEKQVFLSASPLDFSYVQALYDRVPEELRPRMFYPPARPQYPAYLRQQARLMETVQEQDILLSYPYESIRPLLDTVREAASDPSVVSIKITLYRIARESKLAESLITASENGKEVTVIMELRARFDEQNNIDWANRLEKAGCRVIYGSGAYKVHAKLCLITRRALNRTRYITHVGTGNYNEKTAELYTDLALITSNEEIGLDAANFFRNMDLDNLYGEYRHLLVAPYGFKNEILEFIRRETAKEERGRIMIKINSITDRDIIDKLAEASQAGVRVKLIVRGICCILPGVPGATENISVMSVVGRFLEHSRVYAFGDGEDRVVYISSADFMTRNTERRVEIACPVLDRNLANRICDLLELIQLDAVKAWDMKKDGSYERRPVQAGGLNSQEYLIKEARETRSDYLGQRKKTPGLLAWAREQLDLLTRRRA